MKAIMRGLMGKQMDRVLITIPPDVPMSLDLSVAQGGGHVELGGLWLKEVRIGMMQGGVEVEVSEPTREPLDRLDIEATMGGGSFRSLGNASPAAMDLEATMGGFEIDLTGAWARDADIKINATMGGSEVRLPRNVNIEGAGAMDVRGGGRVSEQDDDAPPRPTLRFESSASMGGVDLYYE